MCGIAGEVSAGHVDPLVSRQICRVMEHRGPDGTGFHDEPHATLGMRRLAVIDIATGDQPVSNEDGGVVAVFNGEVYNFAVLRTELEARGHRFATRGDAECLVHLYEEHGDDLARHLRGRFAFAVWDSGRRLLVLGRDRFGKKPLYYRADGQALRFASELKSLAQDADLLTDTTSRNRGLFRPQSVAALLREHQEGRDHASRIWALTQLEQWHRHFGPVGPVPSGRPLCQGGT